MQKILYKNTEHCAYNTDWMHNQVQQYNLQNLRKICLYCTTLNYEYGTCILYLHPICFTFLKIIIWLKGYILLKTLFCKFMLLTPLDCNTGLILTQIKCSTVSFPALMTHWKYMIWLTVHCVKAGFTKAKRTLCRYKEYCSYAHLHYFNPPSILPCIIIGILILDNISCIYKQFIKL